jgi:hypothetical protein
MSNILKSFLTGVFGPDLKSYSHASRLYVDNYYQYAPKNGWIYYVMFNINPDITLPLVQSFRQNNPTIGALVKSADLPKFKMATEVLNQYNKKTYVQSKIEYTPVALTMHDDHDNTTTALWEAYYRYYFADNSEQSKSFVSGPEKFNDLKYRPQPSEGSRVDYGMNNGIKTYKPFFKSISLFQLNRQQFTGFNLVNPIITDWAHDSLNQSEGKLLENKMTIGYETVQYATGKLKSNNINSPDAFLELIYDKTPSPSGIGGTGLPNIFGGIKGITDLLGGDAAQSGFVAYPLGGDENSPIPGRPKPATSIFGLLKTVGGKTGYDIAGGFLKGAIGDKVSKGLKGLGVSSNIASRIAGPAGSIGTSLLLGGITKALTPTKAGLNGNRAVVNQVGAGAIAAGADSAQQAAQTQQTLNNSQGASTDVDAANQAVTDSQAKIQDLEDKIATNQAIKAQFQSELDAADASGDPDQKAVVLAKLADAGYTDPDAMATNLIQAQGQLTRAQTQLEQATQLQSDAQSASKAEGDSPAEQPRVNPNEAVQPTNNNNDDDDVEDPAEGNANAGDNAESVDYGP